MGRNVIDNYHARMRRVLVFIDGHLGENLSVGVLSDVAAFSKHHFQRQFSSLFGISVGRYVQLARLKRASYRLVFRDGSSVRGIALDSGYERPEAFSRAFRRHFDQSPTGFRREPRWNPWLAATAPLTQARSKTMSSTFTDADIRFPPQTDDHNVRRRRRRRTLSVAVYPRHFGAETTGLVGGQGRERGAGRLIPPLDRLHHREIDPERRAFALHALDAQAAAMAVHDVLDDRQAQARA